MNKQERLAELEKQTSKADLPLKDTALNVVFGKGNPDAPIVFIGEAPGANEDEQGVPFVGKAGQQLDTLLQNIGLGLDDIYIANILKYRPPKNRDPKPDEIALHTPFLVKQIDVIEPAVIATLGNFATKFVLGGFSVEGMKSIPGISSIHGKVQQVSRNGKTYHVVPLYHPAAQIYRPQLKEVMANDFQHMGAYLVSVLDGEVAEKIQAALDKQPSDKQKTLF